jgi:hypothetical protein
MTGFLKCAAMFAALGMAGTAQAQPARTVASKNVCLRTIDIRDTKVIDSRTILFEMNNGHAWRNSLATDCPGLKFNGFTYAVTPNDEICGNLQSIRSNQSHAVCLLGPFTPEGRSDAVDTAAPTQTAPAQPVPDKIAPPTGGG